MNTNTLTYGTLYTLLNTHTYALYNYYDIFPVFPRTYTTEKSKYFLNFCHVMYILLRIPMFRNLFFYWFVSVWTVSPRPTGPMRIASGKLSRNGL